MTVNSINNKIVCEPYKGGKELKSEVKSGFASVKQKNNLVGLRVLCDATLNLGGVKHTVPKGSVVYFAEETLYTHQQYQKSMESDVIEEPFVLAESAHVIMVKGLD